MTNSLDALSLIVGVIAAFVAQVSYDVIANLGNPSVWQNHLLAGITVSAFLMVVLLSIALATRTKPKL
jgi:hypothetical protein